MRARIMVLRRLDSGAVPEEIAAKGMELATWARDLATEWDGNITERRAAVISEALAIAAMAFAGLAEGFNTISALYYALARAPKTEPVERKIPKDQLS